jgi:hypothetical protein
MLVVTDISRRDEAAQQTNDNVPPSDALFDVDELTDVVGTAAISALYPRLTNDDVSIVHWRSPISF